VRRRRDAAQFGVGGVSTAVDETWTTAKGALYGFEQP
jgi:hypothetical protein